LEILTKGKKKWKSKVSERRKGESPVLEGGGGGGPIRLKIFS